MQKTIYSSQICKNILKRKTKTWSLIQRNNNQFENEQREEIETDAYKNTQKIYIDSEINIVKTIRKIMHTAILTKMCKNAKRNKYIYYQYNDVCRKKYIFENKKLSCKKSTRKKGENGEGSISKNDEINHKLIRDVFIF